MTAENDICKTCVDRYCIQGKQGNIPVRTIVSKASREVIGQVINSTNQKCKEAHEAMEEQPGEDAGYDGVNPRFIGS